MTRILIVDDHAVVRQGVKQVLSHSQIENPHLGEAKDAAEMLAQVRKSPWDVVILDVGLPDRSGLDVLVDIKKINPHLPVLVLSAYPEDQLAIRLLKTGASGYLSKQSALEELPSALSKILAGGRYVSSALAERLALNLEETVEQQPHEGLSDREYQILCMLAGGKTTTEISHELMLAASTVSTYRTRVLRKLRLRKRSDLVRYALHHKLIQEPNPI